MRGVAHRVSNQRTLRDSQFSDPRFTSRNRKTSQSDRAYSAARPNSQRASRVSYETRGGVESPLRTQRAQNNVGTRGYDQRKTTVRTQRSSLDVPPRVGAQRVSSQSYKNTQSNTERNRLRTNSISDNHPAGNLSYGVRNSWEQQEQEEECLQNQTPQKASLTDSLKKKMRSAKAEKQFNRTIGSDDTSAESGSRAALYEMRMGKTHRRTTEMQNTQTSGGKKKKKIGHSLSGVASRLAATATIIVLFCGVLLYQPVADLYNETRKIQKLEAEYQALEEHNVALQAEVDFLKTDEGLESYAREQYGLIGYGEHQVVVENVSSSIDKTAVTNAGHTVLTSGVKTPDTWYSGVLDIVFGYKE